MTMKLFYSPGACSLSPHIVLRETGSAFELIKTDLRAKTAEGGQDFRAINPSGMVPALALDDGTVLTEGPVIVQYIADQAGATKLAPANGTLARYKVQSWLNYISTELHKTFSPLFAANSNDGAKAFAHTRLADRLAVVDKHLASQPYLMGNDVTLPDIYLFVVLTWAPMVKVDMTPYANLAAFNARMAARPAVQAAMKAEGLTS